MGALHMIPLLNRGGEPSYLRSSHDPPATSHRGGCQSRARRNNPHSVPEVEKSAESRAWVRAFAVTCNRADQRSERRLRCALILVPG